MRNGMEYRTEHIQRGRHDRPNRMEYFVQDRGFVAALHRVAAEAACRDMPGQFDHFAGEAAAAALAVCATCPVKAECLAVVMPRGNSFDGVAGGIVWREGREQ